MALTVAWARLPARRAGYHQPLPMTESISSALSPSPAQARRLPGDQFVWYVVLLEALTFCVLFGAFAFARVAHLELFNASQQRLNVSAGAINTALLLTASWCVARAVLAAGSLPPTDLPLREDLRSRLGWGHVFQLHAPTEGECRALLQQAAAQRGLALGEGVTDYVLTRFSRDVGSLMRLLERLDRYSLQTRRAVTIPLIKAMLEEGA